MKRLICLLITFCVSSYAYGSVVVREAESTRLACHDPLIDISGELTDDTVRDFKAALVKVDRRLNKKCEGISVRISSPGGDVRAAMKIGSMLRERRALLIVAYRTRCLSSCVLVIAGAVRRLISGEVGIHRPHYPDLEYGVSPSALRKRRDSDLEAMRYYLAKMDIPAALLEEMQSIPPERMRILSEFELQRYRLNQTDPVQDEIDASNNAKIRGITTGEWRRRQAQSDAICYPLLERYYNGTSESQRLWQECETCIKDKEWVKNWQYECSQFLK